MAQQENKNKPKLPETERRFYTGLDFRAIQEGEKDDETYVIEGHPAVYNRETVIGCFFNEVIESGAFDGTDLTDVPLLINHDMRRIPLARSRNNNGSSTMTLSVDAKGLAMSATLDAEHNQEASQLYSAIKRSDIDGMSFCFRVKDEEWTGLDTDMPTRHIKAISKVFEVSPVTFPAYQDTDIFARDQEAALESAKHALESARAAAAPEGTGQSSEDDMRAVYKLKNQILGGQ